jgi:hypothetical protein
MMNFAYSLIPDNALEWIAAGMGLLVGLVFALDWKVPKNLASAVSDPRLKSLKYFVGGFIVALIADWQKIVGANVEISKLRITGFYTIPFLLATLASLAVMSGVISLQMRRIRSTAPEDYPDPPFNPILAYIHYGYAHYQDEYAQKLAEKREARVRELEQAQAQHSNRLRASTMKATASLAASIVAVEQCTDPNIARVVAQKVLEYVCLTAESYVGDATPINANYMLAVPYASSTPQQKAEIRYGFGDAAGYEFLLILNAQAYAKLEGNESFALGVGAKKSGWENLALPGAPTAFLRAEPMVVYTEKLIFGKDVPKEIQKEIRDYFETKSFKSFISIVIPGPLHPRGIMNIEFVARDPFAGSPATSELVKLVEPFCSVLSLIFK